MFGTARRVLRLGSSSAGAGRLAHGHSEGAIKARLSTPPPMSHVADAIYGGFDGTVTTFAIVAGVAGASLSPAVTLILGVANLVADGFSMAAGAFLSTRAEEQRYATLREFEERSIADTPDGEREEIRQILARMGVTGEALPAAMRSITAEPGAWVDLMLLGEYGVTGRRRNPRLAAVSTFGAFVLFGAVPLLPYAAKLPSPFALAMMLTAISFVGIGLMKARHAGRPAGASIPETLAVGAGAALLAFAVGHLMSGLA